MSSEVTGRQAGGETELPLDFWHLVFDQLSWQTTRSDMAVLRQVCKLFRDLADRWMFSRAELVVSPPPPSDLPYDDLVVSTSVPRIVETQACCFHVALKSFPLVPVDGWLIPRTDKPPSSPPASPTWTIQPRRLRQLRITGDNKTTFHHFSRVIRSPLSIGQNLRSLILQKVPDIPQTLLKSERDAISAALEQLEFLSIEYQHIPSTKHPALLVPFSELGRGEELTDELFERIPWELQLPCLARKNLRCLSLQLASPTTTCWPEGDFGVIWPRLSTIIIRSCCFDAYGLALLVRAHRATLRQICVRYVASKRVGFQWIGFCQMIRDVVQLDVLEMERLMYRPLTLRTGKVREIHEDDDELGLEVERILGHPRDTNHKLREKVEKILGKETWRQVTLGGLIYLYETWFTPYEAIALWDPCKPMLSLV
ncbi:hypothetical protein GP486_002117 [Trichoglossum hirsutum]|uniref:F-box domain-containing protein n=1 Tax=Trichoglossum hirsutum TaxID=265104 RepID=A0A9P8LEV2_9PEZI|nr:hypothetical protein GP486_002117 [Trichoglossum hirsutum]